MQTKEIYIWIGSAIGIIFLAMLQFVLFKREKDRGPHKFLFSNLFLELVKELLVVILGVTLAIAFTDMVEIDHTKDVAYDLLKIYDYRIEYPQNCINAYITWYEDGLMSEDEVYERAAEKNLSNILGELLGHEEIIKTMHPHIYCLIESAKFSVENCFYHIEKDYNRGYDIISHLERLYQYCNDVLWLMDMEKEHLKGTYNDDEVEQMVIDYTTDYYEGNTYTEEAPS